MTDEELDYYVEMDGCDPDTGEELPEQYELNEKILQGNADASKLVKDTYKSVHFLYGKYITNYTRTFYWAYIIMYITIAVFFGLGIWISIMHKKFFFPAFILMLPCVIGLIYFRYRQKLDLYFYKTKGNRTITLYKSKHNIVIYADKQLFRFMNNKWKKIDSWQHNLGARLLFPKMVGNLSIKNQKDKLIVNGYRGCSYMELKNGILSKIYHNPIIISGAFRNHHCGRPKLIKDIEINTDRYVEIPKSFIDFCKEQGIEPPEECEHLHYV